MPSHEKYDHPDEPPHSCLHIGIAQAKIRRIREWAEVAGPNWIEHLAAEAWDEMEKVREINRELRERARKHKVQNSQRKP